MRLDQAPIWGELGGRPLTVMGPRSLFPAPFAAPQSICSTPEVSAKTRLSRSSSVL